MKYVLAWKMRSAGSASENEASTAQALEVVSKWTPSPDVTIHQFVGRVDGQGGFAVLDSENPAELLKSIAIFTPFAEYTVYPVVDFAEGVQALGEALEFRKSIT
jgi:hypothetical protein